MINSPDGKLQVTFMTKVDADSLLHLYYKVAYKGNEVIQKSLLDIVLDNHLSELAMGLQPDDNDHFEQDMYFVSRRDTTVNNTWHNSFGERSTVVDHYNQSSFCFEKRNKPGYRMQIDIRVYNEGVALRYHFPLNPKGVYYRVMTENTEFVLPEGAEAWYHRWAQASYELLPIKDWADESERPMTCELPNGLYASIGEAGLTDFARMKLKVKKGEPGTLVSSLYAPVDQITPFSTPWRFILVAETPGKLLESNDLILNLNEACKIQDTSWIKPGKIMREIALTNENSKALIDFSAENNIAYILYDGGWYGPPFDFASDASKVAKPFDLQKWIAYGKEHGVGVWLYVNQQALLTQMRDLFPLYKKWGVKGVKFGFVQVGSHRWTDWLHEAIQLAAQNELMVNVHDEFRETGEQRTWPNMLTAEGIRGNEEFPDATHNTILPFTRFIAGPADYTICYMDKRLKTTHAHQLALGVVYFSPLQTIYWYDKPQMLNGLPELEFFKNLPTVWDDTKMLAGEIGKYAVVARRSGKAWFVGAITNDDGRKLPIKLDFLPEGKKYIAHIYADDAAVETKTQVRVKTRNVDRSSVIDADLVDSGGLAVWLEPAD